MMPTNGDIPHRPRRSGWTAVRAEKTFTATVLALFFAAPLGAALGAWTIFQPADAPSIGPVPAYLVAGLLLCTAAGWYTGYRERKAELGRPVLGSWPTYVLAAFAAAAFAVWGAHLSSTVHTPEASLAAAPHGGGSQAPAVPGPDPQSCAGGTPEPCSNVIALIQTTTDAFANNLKTTCQAIVEAAADPQAAGWWPPAQLAQDCTFWLRGGGQVKALDDQRAEAHQLFNRLASYTGWPPPNR
ncbi:hypothetical protein ACQPW3_34860 [Actinosynnema sp. CA-248983]